MGKEASDRFSVDEEVSVVIDVDWNAELLFEHGAECDPSSKAGKVSEISDDAAGVVSWAREGEADGNGVVTEAVFDFLKAITNGFEAVFEVVPLRGDAERFNDGFVPADGGELEAGSPGIEGHHGTRISGGV